MRFTKNEMRVLIGLVLTRRGCNIGSEYDLARSLPFAFYCANYHGQDHSLISPMTLDDLKPIILSFRKVF